MHEPVLWLAFQARKNSSVWLAVYNNLTWALQSGKEKDQVSLRNWKPNKKTLQETKCFSQVKGKIMQGNSDKAFGTEKIDLFFKKTQYRCTGFSYIDSKCDASAGVITGPATNLWEIPTKLQIPLICFKLSFGPGYMHIVPPDILHL